MPVTTKPAAHGARLLEPVTYYKRSAANSTEILQWACEDEHAKMAEIIASSFREITIDSSFHPTRNGFVFGALEAYNEHRHLIISFYINAHAEELRGKFVTHEGQKELLVTQVANLRTADYGKLAQQDMSSAIEKNVVDPDLRVWFMPAFTTTTDTNRVTASVIMMGAVQEYFSYGFNLRCGIPSVTLLGEKSDWETIAERLEKLQTLGDEPRLWYTLLKPVVERFVNTFDYPDSPETKDFWQKIAHSTGGGSGPTYTSGWITAFGFWDVSGSSIYERTETSSQKYTTMSTSMDMLSPFLIFDNTRYHKLDINEIPGGFAAVPVTVYTSGSELKAMMVAGSVGMRFTSSGNPVEKLEFISTPN